MIGCTCLNCGWVHMGLTRANAQQEVDSFNVWFDEQPPAVQDNYGRRSRIDTYEGCFRCGKTEFREAKDDDCPRGCTIQPVIWDIVKEINKNNENNRGSNRLLRGSAMG